MTPDIFEVVIRKGLIVDGSGNPWFRADVGIKEGKIAAVGDLSSAERSKTIDADGSVVCPGFLDIHTHSDTALLINPTADNYIMQGVTTLGVGNCGFSAAPVGDESADPLKDAGPASEVEVDWRTLGEYMSRLERRRIATNVATLVGHGTVREAVLGWADRLPTSTELEEMKAHVAAAMEDGAFGLSTGLMYPPGIFADTDEIVALAEVAARYGGFYATHIRDETNGEKYRQSVREAIEIGERAGLPVQISHLETHYPNWGMQGEILGLLQDARTRGLDVTCDVPPYVLGTTSLTSTLPNWALDGGFTRLLDRLSDPETRERIKNDVASERGMTAVILLDGLWAKIWLVDSERHPEYAGKSLSEIAELRDETPSWDTVFDLLIAEGKELMINCQWHNKEDIRELVKCPLSMIVSDGSVEVSKKGRPNPRSYGSFPLTFRGYVRGETREEEPGEPGTKILTLQEAVRKMTSFPAQRLGLRDRGLLREDMWADIVVFDPEAIEDRASYARPIQYPKGISYVLVNGQMVVEEGKLTGNLPGHVLRHSLR
jgi:N-acyl-D-amino-acid deacylase